MTLKLQTFLLVIFSFILCALVGSGTEGFGWWGDAGEGDESAESDLPVFVLENNQVVLKLNHFDSQQMSTPFDHYYWRTMGPPFRPRFKRAAGGPPEKTAEVPADPAGAGVPPGGAGVPPGGTGVPPGGAAVPPGGAAVPPAAAELRPDEMAADPKQQGANMGAHYPKMVTPNITCLIADDLNSRLKAIAAEFGVRPTKKCPKKLPCQQYLSCSIWRTGFIVAKNFTVDKEKATSFYYQLFIWLHDSKRSEILSIFEECVKYYGLDKPFTGVSLDDGEPENPSEVGHQHAQKKKKRKKHKLRRRETVSEHAAYVGPDTAPAGGGTEVGTVGMTVPVTKEGMSDPKDGLKDCRVRVEDYFECFDTVIVKGLCYWPAIEHA